LILAEGSTLTSEDAKDIALKYKWTDL
jgi:hypothetical protein